jgi:hypothetical protein
MDWLSPITGLAAAAVAVPALVLLYFLRLKRREVVVSSTLLWRRAAEDLRVNAPLQRLKRNILLLLQLMALAAILTALAGPVLSLSAGPGQRYVILIDRSASMNATDAAPTRLAEARRQAREFVASLRDRGTWSLLGDADEAMVIAFGPDTRVLCNFTSDPVQLAAAIDAVEPTDGASRLADALAVAQAFASPPGDETKGRSAAAPAAVELFSDGRIADLDVADAPRGRVRYHRIGQASANVAVVTLEARRAYEQPDRLNVFVGLANYGDSPVECDLEVAIDDDIRAVRAVTLPPRDQARPGADPEPGRAAVAMEVAHPGAGMLRVRLVHDDPLPADNVAWQSVAAVRQLRVALVTPGNEPLLLALRACPVGRVDVLTPEEADSPGALPEGAYDLVVLDRAAPAALPRTNVLSFGPPPQASEVRSVGMLQKQAVVDWQDRHPILHFVNLENVFAGEAMRLDVPRDATVLAEFEQSPALVMVRREGRLLLVSAFDLLKSNWPFDAGFVMFCYNAVAYMAGETGELGVRAQAVGEPLMFQTVQPAARAEVAGPGLPAEPIVADATGLFRFGRTLRSGVYRITVADGPERRFAVNIADAAESRLEPAPDLAMAGQTVEAEASAPAPANRELWPLLVAAALVVVLVEWAVYAAKVRV